PLIMFESLRETLIDTDTIILIVFIFSGIKSPVRESPEGIVVLSHSVPVAAEHQLRACTVHRTCPPGLRRRWTVHRSGSGGEGRGVKHGYSRRCPGGCWFTCGK